MLQHDFQLEVFKRYWLSHPDRWEEIALETYQHLVTSHYEYEILYQKYERLKNNKNVQVKFNCLNNSRNNKNNNFALQQLLKSKFNSATQVIEQLELENQRLRSLITKIGLIIIKFIPKMPKQIVAKINALIDEIAEK